MLLLLALALAESEVYNMTDRHDRVQLCTRVVKDKAMRDKKQLLEDVDYLMVEELKEGDAGFAEFQAAQAEEAKAADATKATEATEAGDDAAPAKTRNLTTAVSEWTKRAVAACMLNAQGSDVEDFKKPGGAFLTWDRVNTLSTWNTSLPQHLSDEGYEDLSRVLLGKDSMSIVGSGWHSGLTAIYCMIVMAALGYGSLFVVNKVTGGGVVRERTKKELKADARKAGKRVALDDDDE